MQIQWHTIYYSIIGTLVKRYNTINDLYVIIADKLSFVPHIQNICSQAMQTLGPIISNTSCFKNDTCLRRLY